MPLDLLKIDEAIHSARTTRQRAYQEARLLYAIRSEIHGLFEDPAYPLRHRSFAAIRARLGIFDTRAEELRNLLFSMGARVVEGDGDDQLWHLPTDAPRPTEPQKPRGPWLLFALAAVAALVLLLGLWQQLFGESIAASVARLTIGGPTYQECLENANGIWMEMMKCHRDFDRL